MRKENSGLNKGMIVETLNNYNILLRETDSIFNYLKTAEKIPYDIQFMGYVFLNDDGESVDVFFEEIGGDSGATIKIPIKAYLLNYELENFIENFKFDY